MQVTNTIAYFFSPTVSDDEKKVYKIDTSKTSKVLPARINENSRSNLSWKKQTSFKVGNKTSEMLPFSRWTGARKSNAQP